MSNELLNYVPSDNYLKDRVILVTGAGAGLGAVIAKAYARFGATVVLLGKVTGELEAVYDAIVAKGHPEPVIHPLDLEGAHGGHYEEMADSIIENFGRLDGVVVNAGHLPTFTPFKQYDPELWGKVTMSNLTANYLLLRACLPALENAEDPAIIFSSHKSNKAYFGAFGVAKGGLDSMCDILADEYDVEGKFIRINRIDSGPIRTQMRTLNFPGENPNTVATPESVLGPYLFFIGPDAGNRTAEKIVFERIDADSTWIGEATT